MCSLTETRMVSGSLCVLLFIFKEVMREVKILWFLPLLKNKGMKKSSNKQLLMNKTGDEIQVALVEEGRLAELIIERPESRRSIGDIYLGRVHKVVEGLKAAFVDIGQKSDGFLHFSDVGTTNEDYRALIEDDDDDENGGAEDSDSDDSLQSGRSDDEPVAGSGCEIGCAKRRQENSGG